MICNQFHTSSACASGHFERIVDRHVITESDQHSPYVRCELVELGICDRAWNTDNDRQHTTRARQLHTLFVT